MAEPVSSAAPQERLHALDAVRGFALLAGIFFHATMSFLPGPLWVVGDTHRSVTLGIVFFVLHIFRMTTFFMIAGFFAHMTFHRRGAKAFIADRLKRIGVPLLVGWPILFVAITAGAIWGAIVMNHGQLPKGPAPAWPALPAFPLTHLWFLYVLLLLYAGTLVVRGLTAMIDRSGAFRAGLDRIVAALVRSPVAPLVLAAPVAAVFALDPEWRIWFGVTTPDMSLVPTAEAAVAFPAAFAFGWLLHRQGDLLKVWERRWALNLALALVFTGAALAFAGLTPNIAPPQADWRHAAGAAVYALAIWTWTFAAVGMAMRFLSGHSPARRYVADASYWLYLIHLPILIVLQIWVSQWDVIWPVKYAVVMGVGLPVMFASYQWLVRYSFIGRLLNGRRERPVKTPKLASAAAQPTLSA